MNDSITSKQWDVFISYSSKEKVTADATCAFLEQRGIKCWIAPREIPPGADWADSILTGISSSRVMVLILSHSANESPQVRREVERAVNKGVLLIPLRIEDILPAKSLEYFLSTSHWLDAFPPPLADHLERLAKTIQVLLNPANTIPDQPRPPDVPKSTPQRRGFHKPRVIAGIAALTLGLITYFATSRRSPQAVEQLVTASLKATDELQDSMDAAWGDVERQRGAIRAAGVALAKLDPSSCPPDFRDAFLRNRQAFDRIRNLVELEPAQDLKSFLEASLNRIGVDVPPASAGLNSAFLSASRQYQAASADFELAAVRHGLLPKRVLNDVRVVTLNDPASGTPRHWKIELQELGLKPGRYEFAFSALALDGGAFDLHFDELWSHHDTGGGTGTIRDRRDNVSYGLICQPLNHQPLPTDPEKARYTSTYSFYVEAKTEAPCRLRMWLRATRLD